jgi:hypothetical protein
MAIPVPVPEPIIEKCTAFSSSVFNVPQIAVKVLVKTEGGRIGTIMRNDNGTFDLGVMQINSSNLSRIQAVYPYVTWRHIAFDPCINIMVGTWFLSEKIKDRDGDIWEGIGDYHSRTPVYHARYLKKAKSAYRKILANEQQLATNYQNQYPKVTVNVDGKSFPNTNKMASIVTPSTATMQKAFNNLIAQNEKVSEAQHGR